MKNAVGNEARIYNYMENVFKTVSGYYNYEYVKILSEKKEIMEEIKDYYNTNIKMGFKKYCYNGDRKSVV